MQNRESRSGGGRRHWKGRSGGRAGGSGNGADGDDDDGKGHLDEGKGPAASPARAASPSSVASPDSTATDAATSGDASDSNGSDSDSDTSSASDASDAGGAGASAEQTIEFEVTLAKRAGQGLGMTLGTMQGQTAVLVVEFYRDDDGDMCCAEECGVIRLRDEVVAINGDQVEGESLSQITGRLGGKAELNMTFKRRIRRAGVANADVGGASGGKGGRKAGGGLGEWAASFSERAAIGFESADEVRGGGGGERGRR
jgi:hypothetical protein